MTPVPTSFNRHRAVHRGSGASHIPRHHSVDVPLFQFACPLSPFLTSALPSYTLIYKLFSPSLQNLMEHGTFLQRRNVLPPPANQPLKAPRNTIYSGLRRHRNTCGGLSGHAADSPDMRRILRTCGGLSGHSDTSPDIGNPTKPLRASWLISSL